MKTFADVYATPPTAVAAAPGRVNLLGEHTDYNDGYVLPIAIPQRTYVSIARAAGNDFRLYSAELDALVTFSLQRAPTVQFASYVYGCIRELDARGIAVPALDIHVRSEVPIGIGVSSSAALEVATLRAIRELLDLSLDDVEIARLAQRAEIKHAHVNCGIMDQMAASLADTGRMLFLDTRTLDRRLLPLPRDTEILVLDSGIPRALADSSYNDRRRECEQAARLLKVKALRDVTQADAVAGLPEPHRRRARHVVTENNRVLKATQQLGALDFGGLMNASHQSLRDDFEVSIAPLDSLVELLLQHPAVYGARLTGAGFGGACVALCRTDHALAVAADILPRYNTAKRQGRVVAPPERLRSDPEH